MSPWGDSTMPQLQIWVKRGAIWSKVEVWMVACSMARCSPEKREWERMNGDDAVEVRFSTISSILDSNFEISMCWATILLFQSLGGRLLCWLVAVHYLVHTFTLGIYCIEGVGYLYRRTRIFSTLSRKAMHFCLRCMSINAHPGNEFSHHYSTCLWEASLAMEKTRGWLQREKWRKS